MSGRRTARRQFLRRTCASTRHTYRANHHDSRAARNDHGRIHAFGYARRHACRFHGCGSHRRHGSQGRRTLADTFAKVDEQSARLANDSEEMENLNRTLTGINKVYELHLKSISLQVGTIDQINDQTHKLANQIEELNAVYGRMIEALTVNMRGNKE